MELIEVAPGVDIEHDVLARMDFKPIIRRDPVLMDAAIFAAEPMNLRQRHGSRCRLRSAWLMTARKHPVLELRAAVGA